MRIEEYVNQPLSQNYQRRGLQSEWLDMGSLDVRSGILSVGDCMYFGADRLQLPVETGCYTAQAKMLDFGTDRRIARLRVFLQNTPFTTALAGHYSVDFASVGVCDDTLLSEELTKIDSAEEAEARYFKHLDADYGTIDLVEAPPVRMIFVRSGWGDGNYPAYKFMCGDTVVGLETVFIEETENYEFEGVQEYDVI